MILKNEPLHIHSTRYVLQTRLCVALYLLGSVHCRPSSTSHPLPSTPIHSRHPRPGVSQNLWGRLPASGGERKKEKPKDIDLRTYIIDGIPCPVATLRSKSRSVSCAARPIRYCPPYPYIASNTPLTPFCWLPLYFLRTSHPDSVSGPYPPSTHSVTVPPWPLTAEEYLYYYVVLPRYAVVHLKSPSQSPIPISHIHPGPIPTAYYSVPIHTYSFIPIHTHTYP